MDSILYYLSLTFVLTIYYVPVTYLPQGIYGAWLLFFVSARTNKRHHHLRVGREEEGVSSLRPELAAIARTLQATALEADLLYLCDSEAALNKVSRWIGSARTSRGERECCLLVLNSVTSTP